MPTILEIHGGPYAAYGPHFSTDNQLYAAAGYAVLSVNFRSGVGYGRSFRGIKAREAEKRGAVALHSALEERRQGEARKLA